MPTQTGTIPEEGHQIGRVRPAKYRTIAALFLITGVTLVACGLLAAAIREKNGTGIVMMSLVLLAGLLSLKHARQDGAW